MQIARVSYAYNSILEDKGQPAYMLDALVNRDGKTLVDTHRMFKTRDEFFAAIEEVIPVLSSRTGEEAECACCQGDTDIVMGCDCECHDVKALEVGGA